MEGFLSRACQDLCGVSVGFEGVPSKGSWQRALSGFGGLPFKGLGFEAVTWTLKGLYNAFRFFRASSRVSLRVPCPYSLGAPSNNYGITPHDPNSVQGALRGAPFELSPKQFIRIRFHPSLSGIHIVPV